MIGKIGERADILVCLPLEKIRRLPDRRVIGGNLFRVPDYQHPGIITMQFNPKIEEIRVDMENYFGKMKKFKIDVVIGGDVLNELRKTGRVKGQYSLRNNIIDIYDEEFLLPAEKTELEMLRSLKLRPSF